MRVVLEFHAAMNVKYGAGLCYCYAYTIMRQNGTFISGKGKGSPVYFRA